MRLSPPVPLWYKVRVEWCGKRIVGRGVWGSGMKRVLLLLVVGSVLSGVAAYAAMAQPVVVDRAAG